VAFDRGQLSERWQRAFDYVEAQLGGRVVSAERQARWRPAWFLQIERDGEVLPVYFRGARAEAEHGVLQLRREHTCLALLERHGVPVPHVYGFCPDPEGIVMERAPGRFDLATAEDEAERVAVRNHYMELLAGVHALPTGEFETAGMQRPATARELARGDLDGWIAAYRQAKTRPEPTIEFALDWLARNAPAGRERVGLLLGDAGQFLFERSRVTAILDVELATLGDPAADLGALLSRDLSEPLGDIEHALRHYEATSGEPVDRNVVRYHAVRFGLITPLATAAIVARPPAVADYVQYLSWYLVYARCPLEIVAHMEGVELAPPDLPDEEPEHSSPYAVAHDALRDRFEIFERGDAFQAYRVDALARLAAYLRRCDRFGRALEASDLEDAGRLLGRRPAGGRERDTALEALVAGNRGDLDRELIGYFVRRLQREEFLLAPVMQELAGAHMQILG
jgi:aminoglycoside phosphotransferase (APT) family kinase protein